MIAILITIMVLDLRSPAGSDISSLINVLPDVATYVLSFVFLGIYWNNHHNLLHATSRISGSVLWANLHLLFWLSLIPFATRWMSHTDFLILPTACYGAVQFLSALAYSILVRTIVVHQPPESVLVGAIGDDRKGKLSLVGLFLAVPLTFVSQWLALGILAVVALIWLVPDRRIESRLNAQTRLKSGTD